MASAVADLKDAVKEALEQKGLMPQLQASMRAQIFKLLLASEEQPRPDPCNETLLINELIREYLVFNGLHNTLSVFIPESGQPPARPFDREWLAKRLKVNDTPQSQQVPLLYQLVACQQQLPAAATSHQPQHPPQQQPAAIGNSSRSAASLVGGQQQPVPAAGRLLPPPAGHHEQIVAVKDAVS